MNLLSGYGSSSSSEGGGEEEGAPILPVAAGVMAMRRPPAGALDPAPRTSIPAAVLRIRGLVPTMSTQSTTTTMTIMGTGTGSSSANALILTNNPTSLSLRAPVQGPSLLCDPSDGAALFLRAVDAKTGSTSKVLADAAVDEDAFVKNRNAFQRGDGVAEGGDGVVGGGQRAGLEAALAPGREAREIRRNDYGHARFRPELQQQQETESVSAGKRSVDATATTNTNAPQSRRRLPGPHLPREHAADVPPSRRRKRSEDQYVNDDDDEAAYGIWGPPSKSELHRKEDALTAAQKGEHELPPEILAEREHLAERDRRRGDGEGGEGGPGEKEKFDRLVERKMSHLLPPRLQGEDPEAVSPTTKFHGDAETDYRGRNWTDPPPGARGADFGDVDDHACFVPKKCVHRFVGHSKGVHRIRLSPKTGHLLLSGGLDGNCKVWSVAKKQVMRTYKGHSAAVRDVQFNNDGTKFVSASFDRFLRLWDVASGKVLGTYTNRRVPYVVKFYPKDDNLFVVGCSDNKLVTYDATTGEITQEYDHHLAPVNTISFVEDRGTKMITSGDDKKVLVWEWDIGVPVKYISDPTMHSMPAVTMHPSERYLLCQSLDNRICVYQAGDRYALQRKKKFDGHNVAGYACEVAASPDGRFVVSGDSDGMLFFWDFRRGRVLQKYRAHDKGPSIACVWHPVEASTMFSCGWDGVIKMWE